jgi:5-hydroxyisourate hydrolase
VFDTGEYFSRTGVAGFYPEVEICFTVGDPDQHYHVPLLLSPFAYSTYRGS